MSGGNCFTKFTIFEHKIIFFHTPLRASKFHKRGKVYFSPHAPAFSNAELDACASHMENQRRAKTPAAEQFSLLQN